MRSPPPNGKDELRAQAEAVARDKARLSREAVAVRPPEEAQLVLHELQVHQIELEMQNEELHRTHAELDESRARYFDLFDLAPVGYCTLTEDGLIREANLTAANLLGIPRGALTQRPLTRYIDPADQDVYYLSRKQLIRTGEPQTCELRMVRTEGTRFWASLASSLSASSGGAVHRLMISDISARKLLEQTLQETNLRLEAALAAADKASLAKSEFLSNMSHELRSPLNAVLGFAQLLKGGQPALTARQEASVGQIVRGGWYLLELINDLLDLGAIESGNLSLSLSPTSLSEVLEDCAAMIEPEAKRRGITLSFPEFLAPCLLEADPIRLKQVLVNLLSNAIKYNRPNGACRVTVSGAGAQRLRVTVQDSGQGLSPERIALLFQPFNRLGQEKGFESGTGIGLTVSRRLVELMGGEIGVQSTVGVGSSFWFELKGVHECGLHA